MPNAAVLEAMSGLQPSRTISTSELGKCGVCQGWGVKTTLSHDLPEANIKSC